MLNQQIVPLSWIFLLSMILPVSSFCQLKMSVENRTASIDDGSLIFKAENYRKLADSLDKLLNQGTVDTVVLIERAMIYDLSNNQLAKPLAGDKGGLRAIIKSKNTN